MQSSNPPAGPARRGFTLVEVIVVVLILAALAAIAVVGYGRFTERAQIAADETRLHNIGVAVLAAYTAEGNDGPLTRDLVAAAIEDSFSVTVNSGKSAGSIWNLLGADEEPVSADDYSIAFDAGAADTAVSENSGSRVLIAAATNTRNHLTTAALVSTGPGATQQTGGAVATCVSPERRPSGALLGNLDESTTCSDAPGALPAKMSAPTDVTAQAGNRTIAAAWAAGRGVESYIVTASADGLPDATCTTRALQCTLTGLANTHTYTVVVTGRSPLAELVSEPVTATPQAPALTASPAVSVTAVTHTTADITWDPLDFAESYELQWRIAGSGSWNSVDNLAVTAHTVNPASQSAKLEVRVRGHNTTGPSPWSATATAQLTTPAPTATPALTVGTITHTTAALSWTASQYATTYDLQWRLASNPTWTSVPSLTGRAHTINPGVQSALIYVQVRATNAAGSTPWSAAASAQLTTPAPAAAPTLSVSGITSTTANYAWTPVAGATSYEVRRRVNGGGWTTSPVGTSLSTPMGPTTQGSFIEVQARAVNVGGTGPWSNQVGAQLSVDGPGVSNWSTSESYPYLSARISNVSCAPGTIVQSQYRDKVTGTSGWNPWQGWTNQDAYGAATGQTAASTSAISAYGVGADIEMSVRCLNPASGQASAAGTWPNTLYHSLPHPWGQYSWVSSYRTVTWGGDCPADLVWRGDWWVQAATFATGQQWVAPGSWSNLGQGWGAGTVSAVGYCHHPARGNSPGFNTYASF